MIFQPDKGFGINARWRKWVRYLQACNQLGKRQCHFVQHAEAYVTQYPKEYAAFVALERMGQL